MVPAVTEVVPNEDFTLAIAFDNGEEGTLDMKPYLGSGVFRKISDYEHFKRVRVAFDTIEWENGVDLDPEFVCAKCKMKGLSGPTHPHGVMGAYNRECRPNARQPDDCWMRQEGTDTNANTR